MLIVIWKCITNQIILNDIYYHKYHHHHLQNSMPVCPWLQNDTKQFCLVPSSNASEGRYSVVQDHSPCSGSWVHIVLRRSFSLYHLVSGFLIAASKALRRSFFMKALATWPNKYHLLRWLMSLEKKTSLESHLLMQIAIHF